MTKNKQNIESKKTGYPHIDKPWMKYYGDISYIPFNHNTNIAEYIKLKNLNNGSNIAESHQGKKITYDELFEKVDNASKVLTGLGVKKHDRIMNLVPNIPESGQIWLGASQIGAVSDFIDPRPDSMDLQANAQKVLELIKFEKANHIVALDKCYLAMLKPIENELKELGIEKIVTLSALDSMNIPGIISYLMDVINYSKLKNKNHTIKKLKSYQVLLQKIKSIQLENQIYDQSVKKSPLEVVKYSDLLKDISSIKFDSVFEGDLLNYIGHTSGTSGSRPKPITLSNANQISGTEQLFMADANFEINDRVLHVLPFFSPLGADNNYILNLASGAHNISIPEFEINEFGYLIKKYKPNVILGPPSWIAALPDSKYLDDLDLSCITRIIYGGDSITAYDEERVNNWLKKHGSEAVLEKGHGMSEYCGCGSFAQKSWNEPNTMGIPLPETIYSIVDPNVEEKLVPLKFEDDMETLTGELAVSSPAVTNGKLDEHIIVPHYELDGDSYIRTRDLVKMDKNGVFSFDSRKDNSFTRFDGYKVKPYEIEDIILKNEKIKYCRIVQYFDKKQRGLMPIAHIVLDDGIFLSQNEMLELIEEIVYKQIIANPDMSSRQIPSRFKIREKLPLTKNSKININELIKEGIDGSEITVEVEETNLAVGEIKIYFSNEPKSDIILNKRI